MNKRLSNRWAAQIGGSYTWAHDFPGAYPNNPNGAFDEDNTRWDFKLSGTYEAPYGLPPVAAGAAPGGRELRAPVLGRRRQRHRGRRASSAARSTSSR